MKESFEANLRHYTEAINEALADTSKEGKARAEKQRVARIEEGARRAHTTPEAEAEIYRLQKQKIEKLRKFKRWLERTRSGDGFVSPEPKPGIPIVRAEKDGTLHVCDDRGRERNVSFGELVSDVAWGKEYTFDASVDVHEMRKWHLAQLKGELRDRLDMQIVESELADAYGDAMKQEAYASVRERREAPLEQRGVIAERMVATFLEQLSYDCDDADFSIEPADVQEDVQGKIDFIVHRREHAHGARIEESEYVDSVYAHRDVGVQFTTAEGKVEQKERQLRRARKNMRGVEDIVLVVIPMKEATAIYKAWQKEGELPGGPARLWSNETKSQVFRAVMGNVLSIEEVDAFCTRHFG